MVEHGTSIATVLCVVHARADVVALASTRNARTYGERVIAVATGVLAGRFEHVECDSRAVGQARGVTPVVCAPERRVPENAVEGCLQVATTTP